MDGNEATCVNPMSVVQPSPIYAPLNGSVLVLIQFDVCEELRLDRLQQTVSARTVQLPSMKHSVPAYVRYQRPPIVEPFRHSSGERREPRGRDQVLRLWRRQRRLPTAFLGRLGEPGAAGQPLGVGCGFCFASGTYRAAETAASGQVHGEAVCALAQRGLLHLPRARGGRIARSGRTDAG